MNAYRVDDPQNLCDFFVFHVNIFFLFLYFSANPMRILEEGAASLSGDGGCDMNSHMEWQRAWEKLYVRPTLHI